MYIKMVQIMGISLLKGKYGYDMGSLMVQIVMLQVYHLAQAHALHVRVLLRLLIMENLPNTAGSLNYR